jgi:hypothetical protein
MDDGAENGVTMSDDRPDHDLLRRIEAGELDSLTPAEIERAERLLNSDSAAAGRVAGQIPPVDANLRDALADAASDSMPREADWDAAWARIEAAAAPARGPMPRTLRWGTSVGAIAACLLVAALWSMPDARRSGTRAPEAWPVVLAHDVEIDALEVGEDTLPIVVATGGDDSVEVIWVMETEG